MKKAIKRWKSLLIVAIMVFGIISNSFTTIAIAAEEEYSISTEETDTILVGDADFDGKIDIRDASIILEFYARIAAGFKDVTTPAEFKVSDINLNGVIDISDATLVLSHYAKCAAGLYDPWPPASSEVTTTTSNVTTTTTTVETTETTTTVTSSNSFFIGDVIANSRLWTLHSKPASSTDTIICLIPVGTQLEVVGYVVQDSWYLVKYQNLIMYVEVDYKYFHKLDASTTTATTLSETSTTMATTLSETTTTMLPETSTTTATTLSETSTTTTMLSETSTTMTTTLSETTTTSITDIIDSYKMGDVIEFSGSKWNVRSGIGTNTDSVGTISYGDSVVVVGYAGYTDYDWYKVVFNGNIGYIGLQYPWCFTQIGEVKECDELASSASSGTFLKFINESWCLRDETYSIVNYIYKGQMMVVEDIDDKYMRVNIDDGSDGYIIYKDSEFDNCFRVYT